MLEDFPPSHMKVPPDHYKGPHTTSKGHAPFWFQLLPWENVNKPMNVNSAIIVIIDYSWAGLAQFTIQGFSTLKWYTCSNLCVLALQYEGIGCTKTSAYAVLLLWTVAWYSEWTLVPSSQPPPGSSMLSQQTVQSIAQRIAGWWQWSCHHSVSAGWRESVNQD